jgi:cell division protein FtsB
MFKGPLQVFFELNIGSTFNELTDKWHKEKAIEMLPTQDIHVLLERLHFFNFSLWHEEDEARRTDVTDSLIAQVKRNIDKFNQNRNDTIQRIDELLYHLLTASNFNLNGGGLNSETPGSMVDRNSIMSLKVFHMNEIATDPKEKEDLRVQCAKKVLKLREQQNDLESCVKNLLADIASGQRHFKVYFQFKMYNDPNLNPALKK